MYVLMFRLLQLRAISLNSPASPSDTSAMNRRTAQTLRVVIVTSLIWFLVDVFLLMYFTDCTNHREARADSCNTGSSALSTGKLAATPKPTPYLASPTPGPVVNFFNRIIPDGRTFSHFCMFK